MSRAIPDRWENYHPIGKKIEGTRFIAFKVPLREHVSVTVQREKRLDDRILLRRIPNLGLIIDLTNTHRYYDPQIFQKEGIQYQKIMIPGKETPPTYLTENFIKVVKEFLYSNKNNDKLVGVHCTHGVNRTGYLICYYMISQMAIEPKDAIGKFANARGYKIERTNYIEKLQKLNWRERNNLKDEFIPKNGQNNYVGNVSNSRARARSRDYSHGESNNNKNWRSRDYSHGGSNKNKNWRSRSRSRSPLRNSYKRENSFSGCQQSEHAERYIDYHCTMSRRPRNLRTDYYNTRPKSNTSHYSYNRFSKEHTTDGKPF